MGYPIVSIEFHENALKSSHDHSVAMLSMDVEDCALSSWGEQSMQTYHNAAIRALKLGEEHDINGPATSVIKLLDTENQVVDAKLIIGQYGHFWLLGADARATYGRTFIPHGEKSRVQKQLGLHEDFVVVPAKPYMSAFCAFIGAPMQVNAIPEEGF